MSTLLHNLRYSVWLAGQVIVAATAVIADTFRPHQKQKPVLIGLPLRIRTDQGLMGFSTSITMTPGTLVAGTRELTPQEADGLADGVTKPKYLFIVHAIFGADLQALFDSLYDMEERLVPGVRGTERPKAFVYSEYDPRVTVDPNAAVGTAKETGDE